jgi:hypothetical protein
MSTSVENDRWLSKPWVLIGIATAVAIAAYFVGSKRADAPRDQLGEEVRRTAAEKESDTALVVGKRNGVNAIHIPSGRKITPCDERSPGQEQCKFSVRKEADGKYVLLDSEQRPFPREQIFSETIAWVHKGSYCTTSSSGGKTTTNCCHSPSCW